MSTRTQVTMDAGLQRRAMARAAELGIPFAEYVRRVVARDLGQPKRQPDISAIFDLVSGGPATDIARDKDRMIAEAVSREHRVRTGAPSRFAARPKKGRR